jgi:hypothetical protein
MYINVNAVLAKIEMLQNFHFSQLLSILLLLNITPVLINANWVIFPFFQKEKKNHRQILTRLNF